MNIKSAIKKELEADAEISAIFKRIYKSFNPFSSAQLNRSIKDSLFPNITVVEVSTSREYCENGISQGSLIAEVQIDFTLLINLTKYTSGSKSVRDGEDDAIEAFDNAVSKWKLKFLARYGSGGSKGIPGITPVAAITRAIVTAETGTQEDVDSSMLKGNFQFYREIFRVSVLYNPILNE